MAVTRAGNTIIATADGDSITGPLRIGAIKIVGGGSGMTVNLKKNGTSGLVVYTGTVGNSAEKLDQGADELINFRGTSLYVNVSAGSGSIYIYLR